jgi:hypothetical protein
MKNKADSQTKLLIEIFDQAFDKPSWHGTNLRGSVRGLTIQQLLWRPGPKRHNIWEIALHAAYWKYAVHRRMTGGEKGLFPRKPSNYPAIPKKPNKSSWQEDLELLTEWHKKLRQIILEFPMTRWNECPPESKWTFLQTAYGVASHDLYHAGQIQLLKRLQKG